MFENEIKFISDFTLNKVKDFGPSFTIVQFLSTEIHPSIKKYVESEINYLIYQDRKKLIENSLFDYSGSKISNYFNLITDEIKKSKKISFEDIKNIIFQAVSFNANFVVRPKWALSKLIFGSNKSVSLNDIEMMLNYTYYYEYLGNVLLAYLNKKKIMSLSATEFELIMNKIDRELFTMHQGKLVDNALYAMADFYNIGGLNKSSVPIEAVEMFLKEKNLTELLFKLKKGFPVPTKKKTDIDDIRKTFYAEFPLESTIFNEDQTQNVVENEPEEQVKIESHFENPLKEQFLNVNEKEVEANEAEKNFDPDLQETSNEKNNLEDDLNLKDEHKEPSVEEVNEDENEAKLKELIEDQQQELNEMKTENLLSETEEGIPLQSEKITDEFEEVIEVTEDEKLLDSFIDEVSNEPEEEIIIIDDKEEENVLEFYEQEQEISIDENEDKLIEEISGLPEKSANVEDGKEDANGKIENQFIEDSKPEKIKQEEIIVEEKIEFEKVAKENSPEQRIEDNSKEAVSTESSNKKNKEKFDDIFSFLSNKEIDKIIRNLFNSDSEDFANTVEKLSACNSLEEAEIILDNIFKYARIKPHSKEASALRGAVTKYFEQGN